MCKIKIIMSSCVLAKFSCSRRATEHMKFHDGRRIRLDAKTEGLHYQMSGYRAFKNVKRQRILRSQINMVKVVPPYVGALESNYQVGLAECTVISIQVILA